MPDNATTPTFTAAEFAAKWLGVTLTERSASQSHFIDLCRMLGIPTPTEANPTGDWYTFEKGVEKTGGGSGFAGVWKHDHFAWEYKGKHKDLDAAYQQLLQYREALGNPPLLVVCDLERFEVHTNFTGTSKQVHAFNLRQLRDAGDEEAEVIDEDFVVALEHGLPHRRPWPRPRPPVILLTDSPSTRDVLLFPHLRRRE